MCGETRIPRDSYVCEKHFTRGNTHPMKPAHINLIFTFRFHLLRVAQIQFVLWSRGAVFIDTLHYDMLQIRTTILLASISYIMYLL